MRNSDAYKDKCTRASRMVSFTKNLTRGEQEVFYCVPRIRYQRFPRSFFNQVRVIPGIGHCTPYPATSDGFFGGIESRPTDVRRLFSQAAVHQEQLKISQVWRGVSS